jgi:hypothetical protein
MDIAEYKKLMTDLYISYEAVKDGYGLTDGLSFDEQFSAASIESILFSDVATSMFVTQELFEQFKKDVLLLINEQMPGTAGWYVYRSLLFQYGKSLVAETDYYDNTGLTDDQIAAMRIVKYAAAVESKDRSILYIKVAAGDANGNRYPLSSGQLTAFKQYINDIQYAGVRIQVISDSPDDMRLNIDIYYDPLVLNELGERLDGLSGTPVQDAIRDHLKNLPFDGVYSNQGMVDMLQHVDGVHIAEIKYAGSRYGAYSQYSEINARETAHAGYYQISDANLSLNFIPDE